MWSVFFLLSCAVPFWIGQCKLTKIKVHHCFRFWFLCNFCSDLFEYFSSLFVRYLFICDFFFLCFFVHNSKLLDARFSATICQALKRCSEGSVSSLNITIVYSHFSLVKKQTSEKEKRTIIWEGFFIQTRQMMVFCSFCFPQKSGWCDKVAFSSSVYSQRSNAKQKHATVYFCCRWNLSWTLKITTGWYKVLARRSRIFVRVAKSSVQCERLRVRIWMERSRRIDPRYLHNINLLSGMFRLSWQFYFACNA